MRCSLAGLAILFCTGATWASAAEVPSLASPLSSVFVFGGVLNDGNLGQTMVVVGNRYEHSGIAGAAYRAEFFRLGSAFNMGAEFGTAVRFGDGTSGEFWGAGTLTYRGFETGGFAFIPTGVFGLSAITNTMGVERARAIEHGGNESLLFYVGFELAISNAKLPGWELVYRVHHRSGGYGVLGGVIEGHNANVLGIRHYF